MPPGHEKKNGRRRPTLARPGDALPSAMEPLTSVFGMGTGMAAPPWPPAEVYRSGMCSGTKENHNPHAKRAGKMMSISKASRHISTGQLNRSRGLHPRPIEVVVCDLASERFRWEGLSSGRLGA